MKRRKRPSSFDSLLLSRGVLAAALIGVFVCYSIVNAGPAQGAE
jgi:hypothetical protein